MNLKAKLYSSAVIPTLVGVATAMIVMSAATAATAATGSGSGARAGNPMAVPAPATAQDYQRTAFGGCNPCKPDLCNPCAGANPCAPKGCNPCNPCAASNPCAGANPCAASNPCAPAGCNPCNPCNPCAAGAHIELSDAEAAAAYNDAKAAIAASYAGADDPAARSYQGWTRYNTVPYISDTHGGRLVNNYANGTARDYGKWEDVGTLPKGSVLAKDSIVIKGDGSAAAGPLFLMEKMADGFDPEYGNWRYTLIMPGGDTFGVTKGVNSDGVAFCGDCHIAVEEQDHLFFLPDEYRRSSD